MTTFPSLLRITFCIFFIIDWAFSQNHEALVFIEDVPLPNQATLPDEATELNGQIIYPDFTKDAKNIEYSYLCPPQTPRIVNEIEKASKRFPGLAFLLEKTRPSAGKQPPQCLEEVNPILRKNFNSEGPAIQCGKLSNQKEYNFGFGYLKLIENQSEGQPEPVFMNLYDICLNSEDLENSWTRHIITKTSMLQEPGFSSQQIPPPHELSTEDYSFPQGTFLNIAKNYEPENEEEKRSKSLLTKSLRYFRKKVKQHTMIPQMMVPQEDLALKLWKKSAAHYVNTAPLWDKLVPVMKAINDGFRKAGIAESAKHRDTIYIYTIAYPCGHHLKLGESCFKRKDLKDHRYNLNIWCKFIYNESKSTGMMVFLHDIPDKPPKKIKSTWFYLRTKLSFKNIECAKQVPCNLRKWADKPAELTNDLLDYAYCCAVDNERAEEFFNIRFKTQLELFDIDRIIDERSRSSQIVLK